MKKNISMVVMILGLVSVPVGASCADEAFTTGKDWSKHMSAREKYISLIPPKMLLEDYDVHLRLGLPQYITLIDAILLKNPQLENEEVSNIFVSTVYLVEPQNREALKAMELDYLSGNYENKPYRSPRLTVEDLLKETHS